jgi:hypothetical protein
MPIKVIKARRRNDGVLEEFVIFFLAVTTGFEIYFVAAGDLRIVREQWRKYTPKKQFRFV